MLEQGNGLQHADFSYNKISEIRLYIVLDSVIERIYHVAHLNLDGNIFKSYTYGRLASLLSHAVVLESVSLKKCKLGDDGLISTFDAISSLKRLTKIDYSENIITNRGLESICPQIGAHIKSVLSELNFNHNEISDRGLKKFLFALEKRQNTLTKLSFIENDITDDGGFYLYEWLKRFRTMNVSHNLNLVKFDLSYNKVMYKGLEDIESQLIINRKF